jgi:hypothetical protein
MRTKIVSAVVALAILLLPLSSIVLHPQPNAADGNTSAEADLLDIIQRPRAAKALPIIGDTYSEKIIKGRPYAR